MRVGLGLHLGHSPGIIGGAPAIFDTTTLAWSLLLREAYATPTWTSDASAGASGGRTVTESGSDFPAVGATLDGAACADFDPTAPGDRLISALACSSFVGASAFTFRALVKVDATAADPGSGARYGGRHIAGDDPAGGYLHFGLNDDGFYVSVYEGGYKDQLAAYAGPAGDWLACYARLTPGANPGVDPGVLKARVNNGAWTAGVAVTAVDDLSFAFRLGVGYAALNFDGLMREVAVSLTALSDGDVDNDYSYLKATYPTAALP